MARKLLLVAVTVWFGRDPGYQIYAGVWVLLIAVALQVLCQPYEDALMGRIESLMLCAVLVSLLLGNAIALNGLSATSEDAVRTIVALLNVSMLLYFGLCFTQSARGVGRELQRRKREAKLRTTQQAKSFTVRNPVARAGAANGDDALPTAEL